MWNDLLNMYDVSKENTELRDSGLMGYLTDIIILIFSTVQI